MYGEVALDVAISSTQSPYFALSSEEDDDKKGLKKKKRKYSTRQLSVETVKLIQIIPIIKYDETFFNQDCIDFAKALLGQLIVRKVNGQRLSGFVAEVECYLGYEDVASHSFRGKRTPRNEPMFMKPGTSYVYSIYGMYNCFNISCKGNGTCVLVRALEPYEGMTVMEELRKNRRSSNRKLAWKDLCNGPSKLCQSLNIVKDICNKVDMAESDIFWVEKGPRIDDKCAVVSKRIGIESAGALWANKPLRFYILGNACVSLRDKNAEQILLDSS